MITLTVRGADHGRRPAAGPAGPAAGTPAAPRLPAARPHVRRCGHRFVPARPGPKSG
ncbi:hypothetical protein ACFQ2B_05345 [Streptomyces stramineus]